jgi:hypothetical protein
MIIRRDDRGVEVPQDIANKRTAILEETDRLEAAIASADSVEVLITVVSSQQWPTDS